MELKEPEDNKSFEANGKTYHLTDKLSIERFIAFQKLEVEFAYGVGFNGVMKSLNKSIDYLNKLELVNAAVELSNTRDSIKRNDLDKRVPAVDMCSLFLNTKDEDVRVITDEMLAEKQKDFTEAGIPISFFLDLAKNLTIGFRQHLNPGE